MFITLYDDPDAAADTDELDVRKVPKSQRHPMIFARFDALAAGESFVLVNSHDPIHLREEFARDRPGAYDWRYLEGSHSDRLWPDPDHPNHRTRAGRVALTPPHHRRWRNPVTTLSKECSRSNGLDARIVNAPIGEAVR